MKKPLVAHLFFVFFIYNQHCTLFFSFLLVLYSIPDKCQIEEVWTSRFQALGPWVCLSRKESRPHCFLNPKWKNIFGHMWRCWSVCELCLSRFGHYIVWKPIPAWKLRQFDPRVVQRKTPFNGKKVKETSGGGGIPLLAQTDIGVCCTKQSDILKLQCGQWGWQNNKTYRIRKRASNHQAPQNRFVRN